MPFDAAPQNHDNGATLRIRFSSDLYVDGLSYRDTEAGSLFDALKWLSHTEGDKLQVLDIAPLSPWDGSPRFASSCGKEIPLDEYPYERSSLNFPQVKKYGMTTETRRAHKSANHPGLKVRAYQYAMAMCGRQTGHSSTMRNSGFNVALDRVSIDGQRYKSKRARHVLIDDAWFNIPHWDYVELGATEECKEALG